MNNKVYKLGYLGAITSAVGILMKLGNLPGATIAMMSGIVLTVIFISIFLYFNKNLL
ncbi:hypothetical protein V6R21_18410 [Limibacter armeniacum]|uniref:hypothetical protein n=1 Tax=Limibacter armeniacum TaxID=466084 RepID=UPI002FE5A909